MTGKLRNAYVNAELHQIAFIFRKILEKTEVVFYNSSKMFFGFVSSTEITLLRPVILSCMYFIEREDLK